MYKKPDDIENSGTDDEQQKTQNTSGSLDGPREANGRSSGGQQANTHPYRQPGNGVNSGRRTTQSNDENRERNPNAGAADAGASGDASNGRQAGIVERSDHYIKELDECGAYDHTHRLGGVTVEYADGVASYTPEAVGASLLAIAGASAELGGVFGKASAVAIGSAAMQFNTDSLTLTSVEYDIGGGIWTQTMYKVNLSPKWHDESPNSGVPISTAPGHPSRF